MNRLLVPAFLLLALPLTGCPSANTTVPPAAQAPGYATPFDQSAGESLKAAHDLVLKATKDYPTLSAAQQAGIKPTLNAFVNAVNTADVIYLAFHQGTATQAQVQTQLNLVATAQANYTAMGTK